MWLDLEEPLKELGYTLWETTSLVFTLWAPQGQDPLSSGFCYITPIRETDPDEVCFTLFNSGVSHAPWDATCAQVKVFFVRVALSDLLALRRVTMLLFVLSKSEVMVKII